MNDEPTQDEMFVVCRASTLLKRCPFCKADGDGLTFGYNTQLGVWRVACPTCGAQGPLAGTPVKAVEQWNRRGKA
jgi:Lar family restriction alleviation protein